MRSDALADVLDGELEPAQEGVKADSLAVEKAGAGRHREIGLASDVGGC